MRMELIIFVMLLSFSGISFALDCSTSAYATSCDKCSFSASGKMNETCYNSYQDWGKKCIAEKRPLLASTYANGQCPEVNVCAQQLQSCKDAASTGNDKQDCLNPLVGTCFVESDACIAKADTECQSELNATADALINWCPIPVFMIFLSAGAFFYSKSVGTNPED